ncbi:MAG TPA: lysylphosphatidylglycerol synthase transmembrane domain-containing protein [Solirubrobacteraceae bacterium]|nr:lysylphosphatidylglycerol synthase transmembrane domain-containing protein [Solirubrobacteraceae bacterium]
MPEELSPRRLARRLLELAAVVVVVALVVAFGPDLGSLRREIEHASPGWLVAGIVLEVLSALVFRAVFCPRMSWRFSYQIGMAEQAANSVLSVSGAGGLALGAWALHRGGMSTEHIARRSVAFFFLTSLANVGGVILFALLYGTGVLSPDPNQALTYSFGAAALVLTVAVVGLLPLVGRNQPWAKRTQEGGKVKTALRWVRYSLGQGIRDGLYLLRHRPVGVLGGSIGFLVFDLAVLGVSFRAFGASPPVGVLALGYLIGQLGGNVPLPGGIGGVDGGLIGAFVLYHQPLAETTAAVLVYHAIALWVPALLGTAAFIRLRRTLAEEDQPAAMCAPLAEPIETVRRTPVSAGAGAS